MTPAEVARLIESHPGRWACEEQLQEHIGAVLRPHGFTREVVAGHNRFDLFGGAGLVVEVKVAGSRAAVLRQLGRYAALDEVGGIVLAATKPALGVATPAILGGKPVAVARLWLWGLR